LPHFDRLSAAAFSEPSLKRPSCRFGGHALLPRRDLGSCPEAWCS
jgi:hypothetical protein